MIVACPSCETKYNLPDDKVPEKGLKVKCSKCEHVFRVAPPAPDADAEAAALATAAEAASRQAPLATAQESAPNSAKDTAQDSGDDFDKAFEEAMAEQGDPDSTDAFDDLASGLADGESETDSAPAESLDDADDLPEDVLPEESLPEDILPADEDEDDGFSDDLIGDLDDDFGETPDNAVQSGESSPADQDSEDDNDIFGGLDDLDDLDDEADQDGAKTPGHGIDLDHLDDDLDGADLEDDLAGQDLQEEDSEEEEYDEEDRTDLFQSLSGDDLDLEPEPKRGGLGKFLLYLLLLLLLGGGAAVGTYNFGLWALPDSMQGTGIRLGFDLPFKVPFVLGPDEPEQPEPGELPAERIKKIHPVDFRQYVITNETAGPLFVVEGKALNKFSEPKERIKVLVTLFDAEGNVLASQEQMCGNTLSLLQLQVQTREEIVESLNSSAGIYANNSFIKPEQTTPFMVVFFDPPENVMEYQIEIVDARDPKR